MRWESVVSVQNLKLAWRRINNITIFEQELFDLGTKQPVLIAFGKDTERVVRRNLGAKYKVVGIPHYAKYISADSYRQEVNEIFTGIS